MISNLLYKLTADVDHKNQNKKMLTNKFMLFSLRVLNYEIVETINKTGLKSRANVTLGR